MLFAKIFLDKLDINCLMYNKEFSQKSLLRMTLASLYMREFYVKLTLKSFVTKGDDINLQKQEGGNGIVTFAVYE